MDLVRILVLMLVVTVRLVPATHARTGRRQGVAPPEGRELALQVELLVGQSGSQDLELGLELGLAAGELVLDLGAELGLARVRATGPRREPLLRQAQLVPRALEKVEPWVEPGAEPFGAEPSVEPSPPSPEPCFFAPNQS